MTKLDWRRAPKKMLINEHMLYKSNFITGVRPVYTRKELQIKLERHKKNVEARICNCKRVMEITDVEWKRNKYQKRIQKTEEDYQKLLRDLEPAVQDVEKQHKILQSATDLFWGLTYRLKGINLYR